MSVRAFLKPYFLDSLSAFMATLFERERSPCRRPTASGTGVAKVREPERAKAKAIQRRSL